jgi:hypothetical protein
MIDPLLQIGPHVSVLPVVHGSGDFAWEVRRIMLVHQWDCLAVPLPPSFQEQVETAILELPIPSIVVQRDSQWPIQSAAGEYETSADLDHDPDRDPGASYVPIDPCQPVIAALRTAMGERIPRYFIDLETASFEPYSVPLPDAYALKKVPIERFAAAVLPYLSRPDRTQWEERVRNIAWRLRELTIDYKRILLVAHILDWPWIREAFLDRQLNRPQPDATQSCEWFQVDANALYFLFGEIPYITELYERTRETLADDAHLSIDGVKELLISARDEYHDKYRRRCRSITPRTLSLCLKYIRNLTLIEHGISPQLTTIITAAKQLAGDRYALTVLQKAKEFRYSADLRLPRLKLGIQQASLPDGGILRLVSRLPGPPVVWSRIELIPQPDERQKAEWKQAWNPFSQCSWPPEDQLIENFRQAVFDRALEVMGADLVRTEKFTTSVKDGIDIRDTIRHWYDGDIYVRVLPPNRGKLDCCVMLFDSPAEPRDYPWRTTWFAEHAEESTLCFFATRFLDEPVGPGICQATYGGAMMLYPPLAIPDIWNDPRLDFATTLEERLLAAACLHAQCPHIALLSPAPPGTAWKHLAKKFKKTWIHLPLARFSDSTVQQLRIVHVLNGKHVRSYAADFIRRA